MTDLQEIQDILSLYEQALGQKLNWEKTTIFFSKAVNKDTKAQILDFTLIFLSSDFQIFFGEWRA